MPIYCLNPALPYLEQKALKAKQLLEEAQEVSRKATERYEDVKQLDITLQKQIKDANYVHPTSKFTSFLSTNVDVALRCLNQGKTFTKTVASSVCPMSVSTRNELKSLTLFVVNFVLIFKNHLTRYFLKILKPFCEPPSPNELIDEIEGLGDGLLIEITDSEETDADTSTETTSEKLDNPITNQQTTKFHETIKELSKAAKIQRELLSAHKEYLFNQRK